MEKTNVFLKNQRLRYFLLFTVFFIIFVSTVVVVSYLLFGRLFYIEDSFYLYLSESFRLAKSIFGSGFGFTLSSQIGSDVLYSFAPGFISPVAICFIIGKASSLQLLVFACAVFYSYFGGAFLYFLLNEKNKNNVSAFLAFLFSVLSFVFSQSWGFSVSSWFFYAPLITYIFKKVFISANTDRKTFICLLVTFYLVLGIASFSNPLFLLIVVFSLPWKKSHFSNKYFIYSAVMFLLGLSIWIPIVHSEAMNIGFIKSSPFIYVLSLLFLPFAYVQRKTTNVNSTRKSFLQTLLVFAVLYFGLLILSDRFGLSFCPLGIFPILLAYLSTLDSAAIGNSTPEIDAKVWFTYLFFAFAFGIFSIVGVCLIDLPVLPVVLILVFAVASLSFTYFYFLPVKPKNSVKNEFFNKFYICKIGYVLSVLCILVFSFYSFSSEPIGSQSDETKTTSLIGNLTSNMSDLDQYRIETDLSPSYFSDKSVYSTKTLLDSKTEALSRYGFSKEQNQFSTITAQSIFSFKYSICSVDNPFFTTVKPGESYDYQINPYSFPLCYFASSDFDKTALESEDPVSIQNAFIKSVSGDKTLETLSLVFSGDSSFVFSDVNPFYFRNSSGLDIFVKDTTVGKMLFSVKGEDNLTLFFFNKNAGIKSGDKISFYGSDGSPVTTVSIFEENLGALDKCRQSITPINIVKKSSNSFSSSDVWTPSGSETLIFSIQGPLNVDIHRNIASVNVNPDAYGFYSFSTSPGVFTYSLVIYSDKTVLNNGLSVLVIFLSCFLFVLSNYLENDLYTGRKLAEDRKAPISGGKNNEISI